jgi:Rrf2 family protein
MKFSAQTEYGLKAMVNLARSKNKIKAIKAIAKEETVSVKYLEKILNILRKFELVESFKGANGGYALKKSASKISIGEIVIALEGPIEPMKCVGKACCMEEACSLKSVWTLLGKQIEKTLKNIKLSHLIK